MKTQQEKATSLIHQGHEFHRLKKYDQAITAYQQAINLVPAYGSLNLIIGDILFQQGKFEQAAKSYTETISFLPEHEQAWSSLGQCMLMQKKYQEASEILDKAITFHPNDPVSLYYGAVAAIKTNDTKKATHYLNLAITNRPEWESRAREDNIFKSLFENGQINKKAWWQFWKKNT